MKFYLLTLLGDVEPDLAGPFATPDDVVEAAKRHRAEDPDQEDGLYQLAIDDLGHPAIGAFAGIELEDG
jgi:hypothetical protein